MSEQTAVAERIESSVAALRRPVLVSFEFFPPNDPPMEQTLWSSI